MVRHVLQRFRPQRGVRCGFRRDGDICLLRPLPVLLDVVPFLFYGPTVDDNANLPPAAAADLPSAPATSPAPRPAAAVSNRLAPSLIEAALDSLPDPPPGRAPRHDGWTPDRVRRFLDALGECGVVEDAARAAGMSRRSAYRLRRRAEGRAFHVAWTAAELLARRRLADELVSRALHGCREVIVRDGVVVAERHRFDNRLTLAVLARLDKRVLADDDEARTARLVAADFDEYVDLVCAGDGEEAANFVAARLASDAPKEWEPITEIHRVIVRPGDPIAEEPE